jgi:hypothetical protein
MSLHHRHFRSHRTIASIRFPTSVYHQFRLQNKGSSAYDLGPLLVTEDDDATTWPWIFNFAITTLFTHYSNRSHFAIHQRCRNREGAISAQIAKASIRMGAARPNTEESQDILVTQ